MAYGNMTPAVSGGIASSAANNQIITNVEDLDTRLDVTEGITTNTSGVVGIGNQRLSDRLGPGVTTSATADDRLGSGVGTGSNVTTGSATSQLTDIRSRVTTVESTTTNTSGTVGIGNQRLSDRLGAGVTTAATADARFGSGVGTGANVTTGSASSQLTDIRSRVSTLEAGSGGAGTTVFQTATAFQSTTSTSYVYLTGDPSVVFTAPPSGKVQVTTFSRTTGIADFMSFELWTGGTIGSGSNVLTGDNTIAGDKGSCTRILTGLTAGSQYYVRSVYKWGSGGGTSNAGYAGRVIIVQPVA